MRVPADPRSLPTMMRDAWRSDSHVRQVSRRPTPGELLVGFLRPIGRTAKEFPAGSILRTAAGKFTVEHTTITEQRTEIVLVTQGPGLVARLGLTVVDELRGTWSIGAHTSVYPTSPLGRMYFRCIEPFHHPIIELLLWRFCRRLGAFQAAAQSSGSQAPRA
jgi:hypothetical protein